MQRTPYALAIRSRVLDAVAAAERVRAPVAATDLDAFKSWHPARTGRALRAVAALPPDELGRKLHHCGRGSRGHLWCVTHG